MPSTYTLNNGIELIATGEQSGTWGDTTNTNLELLDTALDGQVTITLSSAGSSGSPNTLPISDGASSNGRNRMVIFDDSSDLGATAYVQLTPNDAEKIVYIRNSLSGDQSILLFQGTYSASNDYELKAGKSAVIYFNGAGSGAVAANVLSDLQVDALAVDTDTLYVDSTNDRVGINEATPLEALHVTTSDSGTTISKTVGSTSGPVFVLDNTDDTTNNLAAIQFASSGSSSADVVATTGIYSINTGRGGTYSYGDLAFYTTGTGGSHDEAMRIDSSQRVLIGTTTSENVGSSAAAGFQVAGTGSNSWISQIRYNNASSGSILIIGKTRSATVGTVGTIVQDDDTLATVAFAGDDGVDVQTQAARIQANVDGTPGANDMPGRLSFWTTADGASSVTERMRISEDGTVSIGYAGSNPALLRLRKETDTSANDGTGILAIQGGASTYQYWIGLDATGFSLGSTSTSRGMRFVTNSSTAMTIDTSQRVLIGNGLTSRGSNLNLQVEGTTFQGSSASFTRNSNDSSPPALRMTKSRGTSTGAVTIVQDDDLLGQLQYQGADGTTAYTAAIITGEVDGTPGTSDMPGRLTFGTTADGANSPTERMRITNGGRVGINTVSESGTPLGYLTIDNDINSANVLTNKASYHVVLGINGSHTGEYIGGIGFGDITQTTIQAAISATDEGTSAAAGIAFATGNTSAVNEAMRIDSGQRLLIGYTANISVADHNAALQIVGQGTADFHGATTSIIGFSNNSNGAYLNFGSGRSNTAGTYTIVANDDTVGQINFAAADGTDMASRAAFINVNIDGAPSSNDTPGRIIFGTTADGASSPTERMRIDSSGAVIINNSGGDAQLYLGGTGGSNRMYLARAGDNGFLWNVDSGYLVFATNNSEAMRINANGAVGINSSGYVKQDSAQFLTIGDGASASGAGLEIIRGEALSGGTGPVIKMHHGPDSGTQVEQRIASVVGDLIISADHQDVHSGTTMEFYIDGSRKLLLNGAGNLVLNSGAGVDFSATGDGSGTETSELLDDYEEGSWTPSFVTTATDPTISYNQRFGRYTKIGNTVYVYLYIKVTSASGGSGTMNISGLPYNNSSNSPISEGNSFQFNYVARTGISSGEVLAGYFRNNDNKINCVIQGTGDTVGYPVSEFTATANLVVYGSGMYTVSS